MFESEEEWDAFLAALRTPLASTFRITGTRKCAAYHFDVSYPYRLKFSFGTHDAAWPSTLAVQRGSFAT